MMRDKVFWMIARDYFVQKFEERTRIRTKKSSTFRDEQSDNSLSLLTLTKYFSRKFLVNFCPCKNIVMSAMYVWMIYDLANTGKNIFVFF